MYRSLFGIIENILTRIIHVIIYGTIKITQIKLNGGSVKIK